MAESQSVPKLSKRQKVKYSFWSVVLLSLGWFCLYAFILEPDQTNFLSVLVFGLLPILWAIALLLSVFDSSPSYILQKVSKTKTWWHFKNAGSTLGGFLKYTFKFGFWILLIIGGIWLVLALGPLWLIVIILAAILYVLISRS
jgi:hypothetical protein